MDAMTQELSKSAAQAKLRCMVALSEADHEQIGELERMFRLGMEEVLVQGNIHCHFCGVLEPSEKWALNGYRCPFCKRTQDGSC